MNIDPAYALIVGTGFSFTATGVWLEVVRRRAADIKPPPVRSPWVLFAITVGLALAAPDFAYAQTTFLQKFLQFTTGPVATTLATAAVILIGGFMAAHRASAATIFLTVTGIWIMLNAGNIEGWIGT